MSVLLALLAAVVAVNPFRVGAVLPERDRTAVAGLGLLVAVAVLGLVAVLSGPLLDALDITTPTARIAAGVAVVLVGARAVLTKPPRPEPSLPGRRAALVPLAFPVLLDPGVTLLTIALASERGVAAAVTIVAAAVALDLAIGLAIRAEAPWTRIGHAAVGVVAVAAGVAVTISGVLDL